MQLRRGPPAALLPTAGTPALRLIKAPVGGPRAPLGWRRWNLFNSYSVRLVAGILLVSLPFTILLGFVMSSWSSQNSIEQTKASAQAAAESADIRIQAWVGERQAELRALAQDNVGELSNPGLNARLLAAAAAHPSFDGIQIFDLSAASVAATAPGNALSPTPSGLTFANSLSVETMGAIQKSQGGLDWTMTAPI